MPKVSVPVKALDKLEEAWRKAAPGLSKKPVKEQISTVAHDPIFQTVAGTSAVTAGTTSVALHEHKRAKKAVNALLKKNDDPMAVFEEAVEKSVASAIGRVAGHLERATPKVQKVGTEAQKWRDGIHGLPTEHAGKHEVTRLLDAAAKLTAGKKYKPKPVAAVAKLDQAIEKAQVPRRLLESKNPVVRRRAADVKHGRSMGGGDLTPVRNTYGLRDHLDVMARRLADGEKASLPKDIKRGLVKLEKAMDSVAKFDEAVTKSVSTKLRVGAQQSQDQGQMMQQAMEQATMSLAPKVAMEVERIRQERMMQMANDKNALQSGAQSPGQGPVGPSQYQGGPQIGLNQGPPALAGPVQGPQTYS